VSDITPTLFRLGDVKPQRVHAKVRSSLYVKGLVIDKQDPVRGDSNEINCTLICTLIRFQMYGAS
jgi:hypothetical protein